MQRINGTNRREKLASRCEIHFTMLNRQKKSLFEGLPTFLISVKKNNEKQYDKKASGVNP